jgi:hypothetical protein
MRRTIIALLGLLLAGCSAALVDLAPDEAALQRFVGRPLAEVRASWGEPQEVVATGGAAEYYWVATHYGRDLLPANLDTAGDPSRAERLADTICRARFTVSDGTVTAAEWIGRECREP